MAVDPNRKSVSSKDLLQELGEKIRPVLARAATCMQVSTHPRVLHPSPTGRLWPDSFLTVVVKV